MKSPIDYFFKMGEKVTKGDPHRQADFIYYMVWILFTAFLWMFAYNSYDLFVNKNLNSITWTLVGFAICSIQYFTLKGMYDQKQMRLKAQVSAEEVNVGTVENMMDGFDNDLKKEVNKNVRKKSKKRGTSSDPIV